MELQLSAGSNTNLSAPAGVCFTDRLPSVVCFLPLGGSLDDWFSARLCKMCQHSLSVKASNFPSIYLFILAISCLSYTDRDDVDNVDAELGCSGKCVALEDHSTWVVWLDAKLSPFGWCIA